MVLRSWQCLALGVAVSVTPAFGSRLHRAPTSGHRHGHAKHVAAVHVIQGQRGIDAERTRQIQAALIQRNYLTGEPTGEWDSTTESAMAKLQSDNGWQTKLTPDSRALIMLGLGPHALPSVSTASSSTYTTANTVNNDANTLASARSISN